MTDIYICSTCLEWHKEGECRGYHLKPVSAGTLSANPRNPERADDGRGVKHKEGQARGPISVEDMRDIAAQLVNEDAITQTIANRLVDTALAADARRLTAGLRSPDEGGR